MTYANVEKKYKEEVSVEHRKQYAQFFTPEPVAQVMAEWLLANPNLETVLDPAFGLGALANAVTKKKTVRIGGYETDSVIADFVFQNGMASNVDLQVSDYMTSNWNDQYDGIICNPPYFKFHDYDNKSNILMVEQHLKCQLSGFTNLYALFMLKSIHQLKPNGRCAYIVPSEFLNADYGVNVKQQLLDSGMLRHVIIIDFMENIFDDALTTACIMLFANDCHSESICFSYVKTLSELQTVYKNFTSIERQQIDSAVKWRTYYAPKTTRRYRHLAPFSKYAKVMRGIATGDNHYFALSASKAHKHRLTEKQMIRCVCKSADVRTPIFTDRQFEQLKNEDKNVYLFNGCADPENESVKAYIKVGEDSKANERYLTSQRSPWYSLEKRPPAPIWVTVFNRNGLRFIRNEANVYNLTTFHCVYPAENTLFHQIDCDLLFAYLQTNLAKDILLENSREYGNGLIKFEPNDINKGMMADLDLLSETDKKKIKVLYADFRLTQNPQTREKLEGIFVQNYVENN